MEEAYSTISGIGERIGVSPITVREVIRANGIAPIFSLDTLEYYGPEEQQRIETALRPQQQPPSPARG